VGRAGSKVNRRYAATLFLTCWPVKNKSFGHGPKHMLGDLHTPQPILMQDVAMACPER